MAKASREVIIIGAGIGGLCAAIALRQAGMDVTVYERAGSFERLGAGLGVWANAIRALRKLGLAGQVIQAGSVVGRAEIRSPAGKILQGAEFAELQGHFGEPNVTMHRAELHRILISALPAGTVRLGMRCSAVEQDSDEVKVHLANGQTDRDETV